MTTNPVLYAENDENDAFLMQRAFKKAGLGSPLHIVMDGNEAIRYLSDFTSDASSQLNAVPRLILLDLNLPQKTGLEVVKWIREQPAMRDVIVLVFTSSTLERDIRSAYVLGANGYLVKPASSEKLVELVSTFRDSCLTANFVAKGWLSFRGNLPPPLAPAEQTMAS